jgi:hypothetical protein
LGINKFQEDKMAQTTLTDDEIRTLVNQVRTAQRWTNALVPLRLKTRPDGRAAVPPLLTVLAKGGDWTKAVAKTLTQLPHLMRQALANEPSRSWAPLITHNTRTLQGEIDALLVALTAAAVNRAKLRRVFEIAATLLHDDAVVLEQALAAETARYAQVQREHREVVHDLQGNRWGWLHFLLNLFKGNVLTRLVETSNERETLAMELEVHQATAALFAQAAQAAHQRATLLAAKAETLAQAEASAQNEIDALKTRLQTKPPFLTSSVNSWRVTHEWITGQPDGTLPSALILGLADPNVPAAATVEAVRVVAQRNAAIQTQSLNVFTALETEAKALGIPLDDETQHPLLLVGEALLVDCLETRPRLWLMPLAHPREFLFQVVPDSAAPFDLADSHIAKFDTVAAAAGWLGFVHVQMGLAREDLDAYVQTRAAFAVAQNDHNLFVLEDLARQWNRRWRHRQRVALARTHHAKNKKLEAKSQSPRPAVSEI